MICPKCGFKRVKNQVECIKCGVIFVKLNPAGSLPIPPAVNIISDSDESSSILKELLLPVPSAPNILAILGRGFLLLILVIWGVKFIFASIESNYAGKSLLHLVNLPFHEAGHIIFRPFGQFIGTLGGTIFQLLMPAICLGTLLLRTRDPFGAAVAQWWLAESFMDTAPYINDARALKLTLLGGITGRQAVDYHDWEYILRKTGLLQLDHFLAYTAQGIGIFLMVIALFWAGANVWGQYTAWRRKDVWTSY